MDVLFINNFNFSNGSSIALPNIGILNLASILRRSNYCVNIFDFAYEKKHGRINFSKDYSEFSIQMVDMILSYDAKIIGFTTMCDTYPFVIDFAEKIKKRDSNVKIMFGGPQASITAEETIKAFNFIDLISIGESESNILAIVDALLNHETDGLQKLKLIPNIVFQSKSQLFVNPKEMHYVDLASLPLIDDSFYEKYFEHMRDYCIDVGRGCPNSCTFCCTNDLWNRKFRLKPIDKIIDEVKHINNLYGITHFNFEHDLFTANRDKLYQFCKTLIDSNLTITWGCSARIDTLNEDIIKVMAQAKCRNIFLGIESGSRTIQNAINKNLIIDDIVSKIRIMKQNGIKITCSFIYGFADEEEEDLNDTLSLIADIVLLDIENIQIHRFFPFPKTKELRKVYDKLFFEIENINCHISESRYLENFESMIKSNKDLFSNFYEFNSKVRDLKWRHIDAFVIILRIMHKFYRYIYKTLFIGFNNVADVYLKYSDWLNHEIKSIDIQNVEVDIEFEYQCKIMRLIDKIVVDLSTSSNERILTTMLTFGKDMLAFSVNNECKVEFKDYPLNVISLHKNGCVMSETEIDENVRIRFSKNENGKLNFKRVL